MRKYFTKRKYFLIYTFYQFIYLFIYFYFLFFYFFCLLIFIEEIFLMYHLIIFLNFEFFDNFFISLFFIYLFINLFIYLFIYLSFYLFIFHFFHRFRTVKSCTGSVSTRISNKTKTETARGRY